MFSTFCPMWRYGRLPSCLGGEWVAARWAGNGQEVPVAMGATTAFTFTNPGSPTCSTVQRGFQLVSAYCFHAA